VELTHLDANDKPKMVDVGDKAITERIATASGIIQMSPDAYEAVVTQTAKKGPVLQRLSSRPSPVPSAPPI
jgi:cyclic pyranopterin phosphate synthase